MATKKDLLNQALNKPPVEKQRLRTIAQGATIGAADEMEAYMRSAVTGQSVDEILADIRGGLSAYSEAYPIESMAYEAGGAITPALFTGGGSAPVSLGRVGLKSALGGAAYAFNTGEGDFYNRLTRTPSGAIAGGIGGLLGFKVGEYATKGFEALVDAARRTTGRKGASVVEREIQRLVEKTGESKETIVKDLIDGKLLAENRTLAGAVRSLYNQSGPAAGIIKKALERRPQTARAATMEQVEEYLSGPNVATTAGKAESEVRKQAASDQLTQEKITEAYSRVKGVNADNEVFIALASALEGVPEAGASLIKRDKRLKGKNRNYKPLFRVNDEGIPVFARRPTLEEAEIVRRAVRDIARKEGKDEIRDVAAATKDLELYLKGKLDDASTDLMDARAQAAAVALNRDAFEDGRKALSGDVNINIMKLEDEYLGSPEAVAAYKAGLLTAMQRMMKGEQRRGLMRKLANEESGERAVFASLLTDDEIEKIVRKASIAEDAELAKQRITGGSITSDAQQAKRDEGAAGLGDLLSVGAYGDPNAVLRITRSIVDSMGRGLTDAERAKVAQILVSDDPEFVRRAISDERLIAELQRRINVLIPRVAEGSRRAGSRVVSDDVSNVIGPAIGEPLRGLIQ